MQKSLVRLVHFALVVLALSLAWQVAIWFFQPASFLFPAPAEVLRVFGSQSGYLAYHAGLTVVEMLLGLLAGALVGIAIALFLSQFPVLDRFLMPVVITTQTLPVFAIAPLLVLWFGFGFTSKVVMASLIIFFPVTSSFYDGLKRTPEEWLDLGRTWGASHFQFLRFLRIPAALPALSSGLRIAATIAPIGAVVGEWAGAAGGLGFVMLQANARTQTDLVFASLLVLAVSAWLLRFCVFSLTEYLLHPSRQTG